MLLHVTHETRYDYTPAVQTAQHLVHLKPRDTPTQQLLQHHLEISPQPAFRNDAADIFGNTRTFFELDATHDELVVCARSRVQTHPGASVTPAAKAVSWDEVREQLRYHANVHYDAAAGFTFPSQFVPQDDSIDAYARPSFDAGRSAFEAVTELNLRIYREFEYDAGSTEINTPAVEALKLRRGVCQDFAHIMIACLRGMGLPARYISGYLLTHPPPGKPRLVGADASHAWVSAWFPDLSVDGKGQWIDFDPTNGRCAGEDYVTLAVGRDFADVSPMRGVLHGGASHILEVRVTVEPLPPGATQPLLEYGSADAKAAENRVKARMHPAPAEAPEDQAPALLPSQSQSQSQSQWQTSDSMQNAWVSAPSRVWPGDPGNDPV